MDEFAWPGGAAGLKRPARRALLVGVQRVSRTGNCLDPDDVVGRVDPMSSESDALAGKALDGLRQRLGTNLASCCVYGSAVRGNWIPGTSDLNLLVVLNESTPAAHECIAQVVAENPGVDPFVLGREGLERSIRAFAGKFSSIRRNYRVLHGVDPLAQFPVDPEVERFLCEQSLRNFRMRLTYAFVTRSPRKPYATHLAANAATLMVLLSQVIRLSENAPGLPTDFEARLPVIEKWFGIDGSVLRELQDFKRKPVPLDDAGVLSWHRRLHPVVDVAVKWIEAHWPANHRI